MMGCAASKNVAVLHNKELETDSNEHGVPGDAEIATASAECPKSTRSEHSVRVHEQISSDEEASQHNTQTCQTDTLVEKESTQDHFEQRHIPDIEFSPDDSVTSSQPESRNSAAAFFDLQDNLAEATVVSVLQNIQNSFSQLSKHAGAGESIAQCRQSPEATARESEAKESDQSTTVQQVVPTPSGQVEDHVLDEPSPSALFHNALRMACTASDTEQLLDLASKNESLKIERTFYCFSKGDLLFKTLRRMSMLRKLDLSGGQCGPVAFRAIVFCLIHDHHITCLDLSGNMANPECSESVGRLLSRNCTIEYLNLSSNNLGKDALSRHIGSGLRENCTLKGLDISSCGATDLHCLCESIRYSTDVALTFLSMSHNCVGDGYQLAIDLSLILESETCKLTTLEIANVGITSAGMDAIAASISVNTSIVHLNLAQNTAKNIFSVGMVIINAAQHKGLIELDMSKTKIEEEASEETWRNRDVTETFESALCFLRLADCGLNSAVINDLLEKLKNRLTSLKMIDISQNNDLKCEDIAAFDDMCGGRLSHIKIALYDQADSLCGILASHFPNLISLDLKKSKLKQSAIDTIRDSCKQRIEEIVLDGIKLGGFSAIDSLIRSPCLSGLRILHLSGCQLNDSDVEPVFNALKGTAGALLPAEILNLSVNRLTSASLISLADSLQQLRTHPLTELNAADNDIADEGLQGLGKVFGSDSHTTNLKTLNLSCNKLSGTSVCHFFSKFVPGEFPLTMLDLRNQASSFGEDEIDVLAKEIRRVFIDVTGSLKTAKHTVNLMGLEGTHVTSFCELDSSMIKTDYVNWRKHTVALNDILEIFWGLEEMGDVSASIQRFHLPSQTWSAIVGKDAPAWAFVSSELSRAVYISHMPATVTIQRLQGMLEMDADCNVKDIFLLKDPIVRKPTGGAWVLFLDVQSLDAAMEWYFSGGAQMYGTPFLMSRVPVVITDESTGAETAAKRELIDRDLLQKREMEDDRRMMEESHQLASERAEYREAHPAYQNGLIS